MERYPPRVQQLTAEERDAMFERWFLRDAEDAAIVEPGALWGLLRHSVLRLADLLWGAPVDRIRAARYVFVGHKYRQLIENLPRQDVAMIAVQSGPLRYARREKLSVCSVFHAQGALARNFPGMKRPDLLDRAFDSLVTGLSGESGRTLVVKTDLNPINRLLVMAARAAGLRTVCIQHGLISPDASLHHSYGWYCDYMMVYDSHHQSILAAQGFDPARLPILGFHSRPIEAERLRTSRTARRVCFLGQPYGHYRAEWGRRYLEILRRAFDELRAAGLEPAFKPHPREADEPYVVEFEPRVDGSMQEGLENFDVHVAIGSTALLEATLVGRVAIQLYDAELSGQRFSDAPYAHLLPVEQLGELPALCRTAEPIDNPELELRSPEAIAKRFVEIVEKLEPAQPRYARPPR